MAPRLLIEVHSHPGALGLCAQAAQPLIWVHTDPRLWDCAPGAAWLLIRLRAHAGFQLWASRPLIEMRAYPGFQVWAPGHWLGYTPTGLLWACVPRHLGR